MKPVLSQLDLPQGDSYILDSFVRGPFGLWTPALSGTPPVAAFGCDRTTENLSSESALGLDLSSSTKRWLQSASMSANSGVYGKEYGTLRVSRGTASYKAGFAFYYRFSFPSSSNVRKMFIGLANAAQTSLDAMSPQTFGQCAGVAIDFSASANQEMYLFGWDGSIAEPITGPTTLGSNYSSGNADRVYEIEVKCPGSGGSITSKITSIPANGSGSVVSSSVTHTTQPSTTTSLLPICIFQGSSSSTIRTHGMFLQGFFR